MLAEIQRQKDQYASSSPSPQSTPEKPVNSGSGAGAGASGSGGGRGARPSGRSNVSPLPYSPNQNDSPEVRVPVDSPEEKKSEVPKKQGFLNKFFGGLKAKVQKGNNNQKPPLTPRQAIAAPDTEFDA